MKSLANLNDQDSLKIKHNRRMIVRPPIFNSNDNRKARPLKITHKKEQAVYSLKYSTTKKYMDAFKENQSTFESMRLLSRKRMEIPNEFFAETSNQKYAVLWLADGPRTEILEPQGQWFPQFNADPGPTATIFRLGIEKQAGNIIYGAQNIKRDVAANWQQLSAWNKSGYWRSPNMESLYKLLTFDDIRKRKGLILALDSNWLEACEQRTAEYLCFLKAGDELTVKEIFGATNQEIRRALMMRAGYERIKMLTDYKVIDYSPQTEAELIHIKDDSQEFSSRSTLAFLKVKDSSTDRIYLLAVPARDDINTVQKARAWGFGFFMNESDKFKPIIET